MSTHQDRDYDGFDARADARNEHRNDDMREDRERRAAAAREVATTESDDEAVGHAG